MISRFNALKVSLDSTRALVGVEAANVASRRFGQGRLATLKSTCLGLALALAGAAGVNGVFMLVSPAGWYGAVPGVTATGPFNQHFVRDIGLIFLLLSLALLVGAGRPPVRTLLWTLAAVWLSGHALFHFWEVTVGICAASALVRDFPAVSLPAILAGLLALWSWREDRRARDV